MGVEHQRGTGQDPNWHEQKQGEQRYANSPCNHDCTPPRYATAVAQLQYSHRTLALGSDFDQITVGAPGLTRTGTSLRTLDFESSASTNSATGATGWR